MDKGLRVKIILSILTAVLTILVLLLSLQRFGYWPGRQGGSKTQQSQTQATSDPKYEIDSTPFSGTISPELDQVSDEIHGIVSSNQQDFAGGGVKLDNSGYVVYFVNPDSPDLVKAKEVAAKHPGVNIEFIQREHPMTEILTDMEDIGQSIPEIAEVSPSYDADGLDIKFAEAARADLEKKLGTKDLTPQRLCQYVENTLQLYVNHVRCGFQTEAELTEVENQHENPNAGEEGSGEESGQPGQEGGGDNPGQDSGQNSNRGH